MGKWMARVYDGVMEPLERRGLKRIRKRLIGKAKGDVLEIGAGTGLNFPYYRHVNHLIALEPDSDMRKRALKRARQYSHIPIKVVEGIAEQLPFADESFDMVIGTLVLCTIPDPHQAMREIKRVLKTGGEAIFFEHIRLENRFWGKLQDVFTPLWKRMADGCHLNRPSLYYFKEAGLKVRQVQYFYRNIFLYVEAVKE